MFLLNMLFLLFLCTAENKAERGAPVPKQKIAAFRVRSSWSADSGTTSSTSFLTPEVINAICKDTTGKEDGSSKVEDNESNNKQGEEETAKTDANESDSSMSKSENNKSSCFNCFSRIVSSPYQLAANAQSDLDNCSQTYLTEGSFKTCAEELAKPSDDATDVATSKRTTPRKIREFSECVYAQMKRDMMQSCIEEVAIANADNSDKVQQFLNTTTCVLAKFRCASFGASTGASRVLAQQTVAALAVATTGELHVFRVPDTTQGLGWTQTKFTAAEWQGAIC